MVYHVDIIFPVNMFGKNQPYDRQVVQGKEGAVHVSCGPSGNIL